MAATCGTESGFCGIDLKQACSPVVMEHYLLACHTALRPFLLTTYGIHGRASAQIC